MDLAIIGGGSSVKNYLPTLWDDLKKFGIDTMAINYAYQKMPYYPDYHVFLDGDFYTQNKNDILTMQKLGVKIISQKNNDLNNQPILTFNTDQNVFLGTEGKDKNLIYKGEQGLSGIFALSYAICLGYSKIFLFGYDYGAINGQTHFYNDIKHRGLNNNSVYFNNSGVREEIKAFDKFKKMGFIYNTSLESNIDVFSKIDFKKYVKKLIKTKL